MSDKRAGVPLPHAWAAPDLDPEHLRCATCGLFPSTHAAPEPQWAYGAIDNTFKDEGIPFRRFYLRRMEDKTGVSRTGRVLEGVLTQAGKVFVEWRPPHSTMGIYNSMAEFLIIHVDCHPSCNEVVWLDE